VRRARRYGWDRIAGHTLAAYAGVVADRPGQARRAWGVPR
jgi:hypothetical protein